MRISILYSSGNYEYLSNIWVLLKQAIESPRVISLMMTYLMIFYLKLSPKTAKSQLKHLNSLLNSTTNTIKPS